MSFRTNADTYTAWAAADMSTPPSRAASDRTDGAARRNLGRDSSGVAGAARPRACGRAAEAERGCDTRPRRGVPRSRAAEPRMKRAEPGPFADPISAPSARRASRDQRGLSLRTPSHLLRRIALRIGLRVVDDERSTPRAHHHPHRCFIYLSDAADDKQCE